MRNREGLSISLVEESMLDNMGVLEGRDGCSRAYGLPEDSVQLFLLIAAAGSSGLTRSRIPKKLRENLDVYLLPLELQCLVTWERNNQGKLTYLVLTWKGEDVLSASKPNRQEPKSAGNARKREVQNR